MVQRNLKLLSAPSHLPSILDLGNHASNPSFANRPVLPDGLSKTRKSPILASGSIHCGIQRTCGQTDRTSSIQQPAERLAVDVHSPCPWPASGLGQNDADTPLVLRRYPVFVDLANGKEFCHVRCRGFFHQGVLLALDVVELLIPLTFCKVDQVKKAVLSRL